MADPTIKKRKRGRPQKHEIPESNKKMGRTSIVDWNEVNKDLMAGMNGMSISRKRGYGEDTLYQACVRDQNMTFSEYRRSMMETGEDFILDRQFAKAMQGSERMLIHLGIHRCGQGKEEVKVSPFQKDIDYEQENMILRTELEKLKEQLNANKPEAGQELCGSDTPL